MRKRSFCHLKLLIFTEGEIPTWGQIEPPRHLSLLNIWCICFTGVGVLEGPMYAVGGHDGWSYLNTVERWDPQARQWSYVAPMSTPRSTAGVAVLGNK